MPFALGASSRKELQGVHPKLIAVVEAAIVLTPQDFSVHDGLRTDAEQQVMVDKGVSQTLASLHLRQPDGFGHAVDLVPFINGKLRWEWPPIYHIAAAVHAAATQQGVALIWGGVWDRPFLSLTGTAAALEQAVEDHAARRKAAGRKAFLDGPHFQLG